MQDSVHVDMTFQGKQTSMQSPIIKKNLFDWSIFIFIKIASVVLASWMSKDISTQN